MAKCGNCGAVFDANDSDPRTPCPTCDATIRIIDAGISLDARADDHIMLELCRREQTISFRESERDGIVTFADEEDGQINDGRAGR